MNLTAWEKRFKITPRFEGLPRPQVIEILKCLPRTNCRECGEPTCLVFATCVADGVKDSAGCPPMMGAERAALDAYMAPFAPGQDGIPW